MTLRLADDTPGGEQMVTALRSPTLGIRTPPEEVEISETNVATKIQGKQRMCRKEIRIHCRQMPLSSQGLTLTRCHRQTAALQCLLPPATLASLLGLLTPALLFTLQETAIPLCPSILTLARIKFDPGMLVDE